MPNRAPLDSLAISLTVFFCLCVGLQQVVLKIVATDITPVLHLALRSGIAGLLVLATMRLQGERISLASGNWKPGLLVGVLFASEFFFIGQALEYTSASRAVVFLYTSPVFAALLLHCFVPHERMAPPQWAGIGLAFAGIVAAFMGPASAASAPDQLIGDLLALCSGAVWGATTVVIRTTRLASVSPKETLFYHLAAAFVLLGIGSAMLDDLTFNPTPLALGALAFQAVVISFVAFLIWFWLIRHYPASQVGVLSFMTPLFGVALGAWILNEPVEPAFLNGALMVIAGITLVSGHSLISQWLQRRAAANSGS